MHEHPSIRAYAVSANCYRLFTRAKSFNTVRFIPSLQARAVLTLLLKRALSTSKLHTRDKQALETRLGINTRFFGSSSGLPPIPTTGLLKVIGDFELGPLLSPIRYELRGLVVDRRLHTAHFSTTSLGLGWGKIAISRVDLYLSGVKEKE